MVFLLSCLPGCRKRAMRADHSEFPGAPVKVERPCDKRVAYFSKCLIPIFPGLTLVSPATGMRMFCSTVCMVLLCRHEDALRVHRRPAPGFAPARGTAHVQEYQR